MENVQFLGICKNNLKKIYNLLVIVKARKKLKNGCYMFKKGLVLGTTSGSL